MSETSTNTLEPAERATSQDKLRILVAEDLSTIRDIASGMLVQAGYTVDVAADGAKAFELAASRKYDLILMDVNMPALDGVAATCMIRDLDAPHGNVPIVAMTAERSPKRLQKIMESGMNGHICKPFARADLLKAIGTFVG